MAEEIEWEELERNEDESDEPNTIQHDDKKRTPPGLVGGPAGIHLLLDDQVKATVVEQLVVFLRKDGTPPSDGQATTVALAPKGAKPGVLVADTVEVTAKVKSIDLKRHKATLQFSDGKSKTFAVRPDVDLTKAKLGEEVVMRTTEALAIVVERP